MKIRHFVLVSVFVAISLSFATSLFAGEENRVFFPLIQSGPGSIPIPTPDALLSAGCDGDCAQAPSWCEPHAVVSASQHGGDVAYQTRGLGHDSPTITEPNDVQHWFCVEERPNANSAP